MFDTLCEKFVTKIYQLCNFEFKSSEVDKNYKTVFAPIRLRKPKSNQFFRKGSYKIIEE